MGDFGWEVGTVVTWRSQSAGTWKEKTGVIVARVPPHADVNEMTYGHARRVRIGNPGMPRDHVSYVVRADGRLYWPRVILLRPAASPDDAKQGRGEP